MNFIDKKYDVFHMFNDQWALATAGTADRYNTMTIAWGSMGTIWGPPCEGRPILTIYVTPARYTHSFLTAEDYFTVSFFDESYRKDLLTLGSHSGRDTDKVAMTGLTPIALEHSVGFQEAETIFICKKIYSQQFEKEKVPEEVRNWIYKQMPPHEMFIGEIVDVIDRTDED